LVALWFSFTVPDSFRFHLLLLIEHTVLDVGFSHKGVLVFSRHDKHVNARSTMCI